MTFDRLPEFDRDLRSLLKKYRSLSEDIDTLCKVLTAEPDARPPLSYRIQDLGTSTCVIKVRKIACRSLKGRGVNSGFRLIYAYFPEVRQITLIQLYFKGDEEREDRERILGYLHSLQR